jgi:hypothetical protein
MDRYGEVLDMLRDRLAAAGEEGWAEELLTAEQGAATSTETIARVSVVLRRLRKEGVASRVGIKKEVKQLERAGQRAWKRAASG